MSTEVLYTVTESS